MSKYLSLYAAFTISFKKNSFNYLPFVLYYFIWSFFFFCTQGIEIEGELPDKVKSYEGVYYNYFSIGTLIYTFSVVA